jgi:hypothetical protein
MTIFIKKLLKSFSLIYSKVTMVINLLTLSSPIFKKCTVIAKEKYISYSFLPIPGLQLDVRKYKVTVLHLQIMK